MKSIIKNKYNPIIILKRFLIFALPVLLLFNFSYLSVYQSQKEALIAEFEYQQHEAMGIISHVLESIIVAAYNDLMLVKNSNEFSDFVKNPSEQNLEQIQQMFYRVTRSKPNFKQLRYISQDGMEIARVNNNDDGIKIVSEDKLQDKSEMYYMQSAISVPDGTMYVSDLDLNVENGEVITPYEPVMRFSVPIVNDVTRNGILIINYDGYQILSILDEYVEINRKFIEVGIYDSAHYWQFKKDSIEESSVLTKSTIDEFIPNDTQMAEEYDHNLYFEKGSRRYHVHFIDEVGDIEVKFESKGNRLGIVSSFDLNEIYANSDNVIVRYPLIALALNILIIILALIIIILRYQNKSESLMLDASKYISEYTHDGIVITDQQKRVIYCNSVFEDTFGFGLDKIKGRDLGEFLRADMKVILSSRDEEPSWEGNIWEMAKDNTYILKYLKVKFIYNKKSSLAYYIGIYSEPKIDKRILDKATWNELSVGHVENNLLLGLDTIFNKNLDAGKENIVIVIKINEFIDIKYRIREREGNRFILTISNKLKKLIGEDGMVLAPGSDLFLIRKPFYGEEKEVENLMESIDNVFTGIQFLDHPGISISYLSGIAISPMHGKGGIELLTNAFIALEAIIKLKKQIT